MEHSNSHLRCHVLESFSRSKTVDGQHNEDMLYLGSGYAAVVDGATRTAGSTFQGKTGGQLCAEAAVSALGKMTGTETHEEALALICREIHDMEQSNSLKDLGIHCCATAGIYSFARREIWLIGDCQASVNGQPISDTKRIDQVFGEVRAIMIHALLRSGRTEQQLLEEDEARKLILPLIDRQRSLENAEDPYSYAVLNGSQPPKNIRVIPVEPGAEIALATDGYPVICPTLAESEACLDDLIRTDPLCYKKFHATKGVTRGRVSFDDRTYLRLRLTD